MTLPPEEAAVARAARHRRRFFMDRDMLGTEYLVPADMRMEWGRLGHCLRGGR